MLKATNTSDNKNYLAWNSQDYILIKNNRDNFICPHCKSRVIFVDGIEVIKHFRHYTVSECEWEGETKNHLEMKKFVKEFFNIPDDDIEFDFGWARPDLVLRQDNKIIAIEVQHSKIAVKKFLERTKNYASHNIPVLWIFDGDMLISKEEQDIPALLREAHDLYCGRVYMFLDNKIIPIHFNKMYRWVDEYDDLYNGVTYGGYDKAYKRKKSIMYGEVLPDTFAGKKLYTFYTSWSGSHPTGYLIAKFYDGNSWSK
jgi:hypothetical protein